MGTCRIFHLSLCSFHCHSYLQSRYPFRKDIVPGWGDGSVVKCSLYAPGDLSSDPQNA